MEIVGIDHVQLAIPPDGEVLARHFYRDVLGLREVARPSTMRPGGVWFQAGPLQLHLGIEEGMRASQKAHPALRVTNLAAWKQRLLAAGCEWQEANDVPGMSRGHTRDPFGNRIELIDVPAYTGAKGSTT
jgi:catechol 2,3-dioxygenase-like lactoylglutathione lyase family enzyme